MSVQYGISQTDSSSFIKKVTVKTDMMYQGANGLYIAYTCDFSDLKRKLKYDSIINQLSFTLEIAFKSAGGTIKMKNGFIDFRGNNNDLVDSNNFENTLALAPKNKGSCFIPYAAFDIAEGENIIAADITLLGSGRGTGYVQHINKQNIIIHKKKQHRVTFNIDYIEVDKKNFKGNVWDFSLFNTDPDVGVSFTLGGTSVWKKNIENNTVFAMGPKSKNIVFMISQDDEIRIKVSDVDFLVDDDIGEIKVKTTANDIGVLHTIDKPSGKIIGCNLNWKIE